MEPTLLYKPTNPDIRRGCVAGLVAFAIGFLGVLSPLAYFILIDVYSTHNWWALTNLFTAATGAFFAGSFLALAVLKGITRYDYWRGAYRCIDCDRALRGTGIPCECAPESERESYEHRRNRPRFRRHRKFVPPVLIAYALLIPFAAAASLLSPNRHHSLAENVIVFHILMCMTILLIGAFLEGILSRPKRGSRWRTRWELFSVLFAIWPIAAAAFLAILAWMREH